LKQYFFRKALIFSPQLPTINKATENNHDGEQRSQHGCRVTDSSFFQGFIPMDIILQQSPLGAGFTERFTLLAIHCAKICKESWSSDYMQKQTHAKTLEVERMYCIDPSSGVGRSDA
jgi:hypothetical protein